MTELDKFAMAALSGMLSNPTLTTHICGQHSDIARVAYEIARAMVRESEDRN